MSTPDPDLPAAPGGRPRPADHPAEAGDSPRPAAPAEASADPAEPDRTPADLTGPAPTDLAAPDLAAADSTPADSLPADSGADPAPGEPGAAVWEARRTRAMRAARGALAGALILEAITVLFVPRAIAPVGGPGLTGGRLAVLLTLAGLLIVASGVQRRRWGLGFGSVLQLAVVATGVLLPAMYVLGIVFGAVWVYLLKVRRDLVRATAGPTT